MKIRIDANQSYDAASSIKLAKAVARFDIQLFEEPARSGDIAGLVKVRRDAGIPIMADESLTDHASLMNLIRSNAVDMIKIGLKQQGGFRRAVEILATARAAGMLCAVGHGFGNNISTMGEIVLASVASNVMDGLECVGPMKMGDSITTTGLDLSNGVCTLPVGPGLGLTLDDSKIERYQWMSASIDRHGMSHQ